MPDFFSLISKGMSSIRSTVIRGWPARPSPAKPTPNASETTRLAISSIGTPAVPEALLDTRAQVYVDRATGKVSASHVILPTAFGPVDLGDGRRLQFDEETLQGRITPSLSGRILDEFDRLPGANVSYSGADVRCMIEVPDAPGKFRKQLLEMTTLSVSVHRVKALVRALGYYNPKGVARGLRTIAGSLILTQFTTDVFLRFLQTVIAKEDSSKNDYYIKTDQIPPFNMTLLFSNEQGYASFRRLLGIELVTDGVTYSGNDMLSEQTISYYAAELTPLLPLTLANWTNPPNHDPRQLRQPGPGDKWMKAGS